MEIDSEGLVGFFEFMFEHLDEKQRRLLAGGIARLLGRGGPTRVAEASGMSRNTVSDGVKSFDAGEAPTGRVRSEGGGRPRLEDIDETLLADLDDLVEPDARGDPMSPLRWTLKSTRQLAKAMKGMGHEISYWMVGYLLKEMGIGCRPRRRCPRAPSTPTETTSSSTSMLWPAGGSVRGSRLSPSIARKKSSSTAARRTGELSGSRRAARTRRRARLPRQECAQGDPLWGVRRRGERGVDVGRRRP